MARLPSAYQEVEYIRGVSSEGPYIDTDFTTTLTMKMEVDAKCDGLGDCVLGTMPISASTNSNFSLGRYNGTTAYMCWNGREIGSGDWSTRKTMIAYQDDGTIYRQFGEDVSSISASLQTLSTPSKLWLFRRNDGGTPSTSAGDVTLYGCKLYDNNILQRNFIPCYRISDGEIGLYDVVNDVFYTNSGSGTFTKGNSVYTFPDFMAIKNFYIENGTPRLPEEYQEVEYIESSGSQYIKTGITTNGNSNKEFVQELELSLTKSSSDYQVFSGNDCCESISTAKNSTIIEGFEFLNEFHKVKSQRVISKNRKAWIDDTLVSEGTTSYFISAPVCIFSSYFSSRPIRYTSAKLKYYKLSIEGTLVRDMIPCYRKLDNVIGMYDLVGGTFYTNSGTGTFTKGNDVNTRMEVAEISRYDGTSRMILWSTIDYAITVDSFIDNYFYSDDTRATARQKISNYLKNGYKYIVMIKFSNPNNNPDWLFFTNVIICDNPFTLFDNETDYGTFEVGSSGYQCGTNIWERNYYAQTYTIDSSPVFVDKMSNNCPVSAFGRSDCLVYTNFDTVFYGRQITKNLDTSPYL